MRQIKFNVTFIDKLGMHAVLFSASEYDTAEAFARSWDGAEKELFIQKVWWRHGA